MVRRTLIYGNFVRFGLLLCCLFSELHVCYAAPCGEVTVSGTDTTYTSYDCGLNAWPGDVPADTTEVVLEENEIAALVYTTPVLPVIELNTRYNLLAEFPDLTGLAATLSICDVSRNEIASVAANRLVILTALTKLILSYNQLTTVPDVSLPSLQILAVTGNPGYVFSPFRLLNESLKELSMNDIDGLVMNPDDLGTLTALKTLRLSNDGFTTFPDLSSVGASLTQLFISKNLYTVIPAQLLQPLTNLGVLDLGMGNLVEFPDISPFIAALRYVDLSGNPFGRAVAEEALAYLVEHVDHAEKRIWMGGTGVQVVPASLCYNNLPLELELSGSALACDCGLRWLKMAELAGAGVVVDARPCASPPEMMEREWSSITLQDLMCSEKRREYTSSEMTGGFTCDTGLYGEVFLGQVSQIQCAVICASNPSCLSMYRYRDGECSTITSGSDPLTDTSDIHMISKF